MTAYIQSHNAQKLSYTLGHNQFSDMTLDEFHRYNHLGKYSPGILSPRKKTSLPNGETNAVSATKLRKRFLRDFPESVDWVEKGAVVPVKNQGKSMHAELSRILSVSFFSIWLIFFH
jgi:Cathepsin propeptide inhibitor domain (I29)